MKRYITFLYCLFFIWVIFPFIFVNELYLWLIPKTEKFSLERESLYIIVWNKPIAEQVIKFKIKNSIFHYELESENNYDLFMLEQQYSLDEIYNLIKNRPESQYYYLLKLLNENDNTYFYQEDLYIINSLKILLNKDIYKNEIKQKYKNFIPKILERVNKTEEKQDYYRIYKQYLIDKIEELK